MQKLLAIAARCLIAVAGLSVAACWPYAYYEQDLIGTEVVPGLRNPIDSDDYLIKKNRHECFSFNQSFAPPNPRWVGEGRMVELAKIENSDRWCVTHKIGDYLILQSVAFNERQCEIVKIGGRLRLTGSCPSSGDLGLWYDSRKKRLAGWVNLPGPGRVFFERITNVRGPAEGQEKWPDIHELGS